MKSTWRHYYTRPTRMQDFELFVRSLLRNTNVTEALYIFCEGKWEAWYKKKEFEGFLKKLAQKILQSSWNVEKHLAEYARMEKKFMSTVQFLVQLSHKQTPSNKLLSAYRAYARAWDSFLPFIWIPWAITYFLEDWFVAELKKKFGEKWKNIYESLARSPHPIQMELLERELLKWKIKKQEKKNLERLAKKFGFLGIYSVNETPWNTKDLIQQIRGIRDPEKQLTELRNNQKENRKQARKALRRLYSYPLLEKVARTIHVYTWLRTERIDLYKRILFSVQPFYRFLEKQNNWKRGWAGHLTCAEIIKLLQGEKEILEKRLAEREQLGYVVHVQNKKTIILTNLKERERLVKRYIPQFGKETRTVIQGKTAYAGFVRGKVRRILHLHDVSSMQKGEILVANMTHPDYMSAIRKATAIVTDEGGIVCHAAIISRELKIPCVIGTGEATKLFKTGDSVEVDAEKGTVKKIV